jgi:hypothetical protein
LGFCLELFRNRFSTYSSSQNSGNIQREICCVRVCRLTWFPFFRFTSISRFLFEEWIVAVPFMNILHSLWNWKVHCDVRLSPPVVAVMNVMKRGSSLPLYVFLIHFNITLPFMWSL